ncbi:hypothetical protein PHLCEN_2v12848 [Hermanssonia centrifuga]|uniref:Uncharacterized protein n=1 Tax=Hermanssonia centrifuga TaxID=98765 RepID=A0A2R6NG27_9APHY|nr:hypothetical protein PHLCEN_2v12848 [Hermanssonia centrifuga]
MKDYFQCLPGAATSSAPTSTPISSSSFTTPSTSSIPTSTSPATPSQTVSNISPEWAAAYTKAQAAVANMSLNDKVNLGTGM